MVNFLKLSGVIINTKFITQILIKPKKYVFHISYGEFSGFTLLGSGNINTEKLTMDVCEVKNPEDYKIVSDWITNDFSNNNNNININNINK
jgi:hypothetical protein